MKTKYVILFTVLVCFVLGMRYTVYSDDRRTAPNNAYTYEVTERKDGSVEVEVQIEPHLSSAAFQAYVQANQERVKQILAAGGDPIEVQITLKQPLAAPDIQKWMANVGLQVASFLVVGSGPNGEKVSSILYGDLTEVPTSEAGPRGQAIVYDGVMVLQGKIAPTAAGLGQLVADERVYLVDTTMAEIHDLLEADSSLAGKPVESIGIPSPFWELMWDEE